MKWRDVRVWHKTDMPTALRNVRYQGQSGSHMLALSFPVLTHSGSQASHFAVTHSNSSANDVVGYVLQRGLGRP